MGGSIPSWHLQSPPKLRAHWEKRSDISQFSQTIRGQSPPIFCLVLYSYCWSSFLVCSYFPDGCKRCTKKDIRYHVWWQNVPEKPTPAPHFFLFIVTSPENCWLLFYHIFYPMFVSSISMFMFVAFHVIPNVFVEFQSVVTYIMIIPYLLTRNSWITSSVIQLFISSR